MNKFDQYTFRISASLFALLLVNYISRDTTLTLIAGIVTYIAIAALGKISRRRCKYAGYSEFKLYYAVTGSDALNEIATEYLTALADERRIGSYEGRMICSPKDGGISSSDLCREIATTLECNRRHLTVISEKLPVNALKTCRSFGITLHYISLKRLYRYMSASGLLPAVDNRRRFCIYTTTLNTLDDPSNRIFNRHLLRSIRYNGAASLLRDMSNYIFNRRNATRYLISACVLSALYFVTPMKIYYLSIAAILLSMSIICVIKNAVF